jgi:hypothetical protein
VDAGTVVVYARSPGSPRHLLVACDIETVHADLGRSKNDPARWQIDASREGGGCHQHTHHPLPERSLNYLSLLDSEPWVIT